MNLDATSLRALADARHHARASLAALRSLSFTPSRRDDLVAISRIGAQLADAIVEIERLELRARLQP